MSLEKLTAYEVIENRTIRDIQAQGMILRHKKSGARIAVLSNEDDNKVFYIGFRTPPEDETGVPHIIEHTTLCGSDKFPVKDPFVELAKGSLNTFLNAMTYPDKTVYPIASCNLQDYKNLMDVYMDAVFHPNITKYQEIFRQEGWHYELEDADAPLTINGVVYNEMKGAYSSPDEVLQTEIYRSLFPDNTYSKDSGGNPVHIPELTYEKYLEFYHRYYHPSNSYIYMYGDMDVEERLEWLDREYLSHYEYEQVDSVIQPQQAFDTMKEVYAEYSVASDDPVEKQTSLAYNKVVGTSLDPVLYQAMDVLDYALCSAPGAPIRQALIDAGIGEDVYGSYDGGVCQPVFSIVAKNADAKDAEHFTEIIENTLRTLAEEGLNENSLLAAINSSEFKFREADFGSYPKGLLYGLQCLDSWLFDDNRPFIHLECLDTYAFLKSRIGTGYYEELIRKYFLDNTHGSIIVVAPKRGKNNEEEEALRRELAAYKDSLSREQIEELVVQTAQLKRYQEEPSPEEELQKIPMLSRDDIRREALPLSNIEDELDGIPVVRHEIKTNGIDYLTLMFDISDVPQEGMGYIGILSSLLGFIDTQSYSYAELSNAINIYTGGIFTSAVAYPVIPQPGEVIAKYEIRIKVLEDNLEQAMKLVNEILLTSDFDNVKRISEVVAQVKARLQVSLSSSGHVVAAARGSSYFSKAAYYKDALHGIEFYRQVCNLEKQLQLDAGVVVDNLKALTAKLFTRSRLLISFTAGEEAFLLAKPVLSGYLKQLSQGTKPGKPAEFVLAQKNEGFMDASQIQYVARCGNFIREGYEYTGALRILKCILGYDYLWIQVRVKGGAYGCMSAFPRSGDCYFVSYRDPNLEKTNEIYEGVPAYIRNFSPDERDMTKYIIGTFGAMDAPLYPEAKGSRSMNAYLSKVTYEMLQKERNQVLEATPEDIRALADLTEAVLQQNNLCVIGNENMLLKSEALFNKLEKL